MSNKKARNGTILLTLVAVVFELPIVVMGYCIIFGVHFSSAQLSAAVGMFLVGVLFIAFSALCWSEL